MTKNSHSFSHFWSFLAWFFRLFTVSDTVMLKKGAHSTWLSLTHVGWWFEAISGPLSHKSMAGRHQKWPIWDQKWPNMAGLPMSGCGPKGSQMVPNGQYNMFLTIWDIFEPHRDIGKPAMLGHFWFQMGHFLCLPAMNLWLNGPKMAWILDLTWVKYIQVEWAPLLSITVSLAEKSLEKMTKNG